MDTSNNVFDLPPTSREYRYPERSKRNQDRHRERYWWKPIKGRRRPKRWWASQEGIEEVIEAHRMLDKAYLGLREVVSQLRINQREQFLKWAKLIQHVRNEMRGVKFRQEELNRVLRMALEAGDVARLILDHDGSIDTLREKLFTPAFIEKEAKRLYREQERRRKISQTLKAKGISPWNNQPVTSANTENEISSTST